MAAEPPFPSWIQAEAIPGYPRFRIGHDGTVWTWGWSYKWHSLKTYENSEGKDAVWINDPYGEKPVGPASCSMMVTIDELLDKTYGKHDEKK